MKQVSAFLFQCALAGMLGYLGANFHSHSGAAPGDVAMRNDVAFAPRSDIAREGLVSAQAPPTRRAQLDAPATQAVGMSYRTAVANALPSVVTVRAARAGAADRGSASVTLGLATGVILEREGFIVTASKVVAEANHLAVVLSDDTVLPARLVASDPDSGVALVKIDAEGLQPIEVGDPGNLAVGDVVLAVGDPLGMGQTVTQGIISAIARKGVALDSVGNVIQTDAAINPGHLGGALLDAAGRLIGINVAIVSWGGGSDGIALAIPVDVVHEVAAGLKKAGRASDPHLVLLSHGASPSH